ncbi:hypothetical protein D3C76_1444630 [compost metagenome]
MSRAIERIADGFNHHGLKGLAAVIKGNHHWGLRGKQRLNSGVAGLLKGLHGAVIGSLSAQISALRNDSRQSAVSRQLLRQ